jgi:hypothetical protein
MSLLEQEITYEFVTELFRQQQDIGSNVCVALLSQQPTPSTKIGTSKMLPVWEPLGFAT